MHSVLATPSFESDCKRAGLSGDEIDHVVLWLSEHPQSGDLMQGTGGARKVRFSGKGKGKSGGYRTIHYYGGEDVPIFLLALLDKGERANLSKAERNALSAELGSLTADYRAGVAEIVEEPKRRR